jgi:hypothetical protein
MAEKLIFTLEIDGGKSITTLKELKSELSRLKGEFNTAQIGSKEFNELGKQIQIVEQKSKELNNSFKEVNNIVPGSVAEIKNNIKELTAALENAVPGTKEFDLILKDLGKNKGELKEIKENIRGLDDGLDNQIKQFAALGQSVAGAFGIAQSAAVLFGEENEELSKSIAKVQASMNLLQSIEAVAGSKDAANIVRRIFLFGNYKKSVDDATISQQANTTATNASATSTNVLDKANRSAVVSFKLLKGALIATGIGILIAGIGELISNWDRLKQTFAGFKIFQDLGDIIDEVKERFVGAFYGIIQGAQQTGKAFQTLFQFFKGDKSFDEVKQSFSDIRKEFDKGFDTGVGIQKDREAAAERKKLLEEEIKDLEININKYKSGSKQRLDAELDLINKKLSLAKKGSEDYKKLLVDQANAEQAITDFNNQKRAESAQKAAEKLQQIEEQIRNKFESQEQKIELEFSVKINQENDENKIVELERQKKEALIQNQIELNEALKTLAEKNKQDTSAYVTEIGILNQQLIASKKQADKELAKQSESTDFSKLSSSIKQQTKIINDEYVNQLNALKSKNLTADQFAAEVEKIEQERANRLVEIKRKELEDKIKLEQKYGIDSTATEQQLADLSIQQAERNTQKELEQLQTSSAQKQQIEQQEQQLKQQLIQEGFAIVEQLLANSKQNELNIVQQRLSTETALIDEQIKKGIISQEQGDKKKKELTERAEKERRKIERDAAIKRKVASISQIVINTALAISQSYAQTGPIAGSALAALMAAIGAVQVATVLAEPLPALKKGGILPNLEEGGVPASDSSPVINVGGRSVDDVLAVNSNNLPVARVNRGEAIMTAGAVQKFAPILSALNVAGGGAKFKGFATGGIPIPSTNSITNITNQTDGLTDEFLAELRSIKEEVSKPARSYVVESDITDTQLNVRRIEERAGF